MAGLDLVALRRPLVSASTRTVGFRWSRSSSLVKATLMRITLHVVAGDEYAVFHQAMLPILRASRLTDRRFLVLQP